MSEKELCELELELEEEELRLKRKRLALAKLKKGVSFSSDTRVTDEKLEVTTPSPECSQSLEVLISRLTAGLTLPKLEIEPFSGKADQYVTFTSTFNSEIVPQVSDNHKRLCYLIYYCRGIAKDAIKHCVLLPKNTGFQSALNILKSQFGRPHQIIQAVTKDLFTGPVIRSNDMDALQGVLRQMQSCQITLNQLDRSADLNCSTNLLKVLKRLPKAIQLKWAEVAETLMSIDKNPTFEDLIALIEKRVAIGTTEYGMLAAETNSAMVPRQTHRVSAAKQTFGGQMCPLCNEGHPLDSCGKFKGFEVSKRWDILKTHRRCFRCLRGNHRIRDCKVRTFCQMDGCTKTHHPLLHTGEPNAKNVSEPGHVCSSYSLQVAGIQLGFVPVTVTGPSGSATTYAFLDNGSDCTLISRSLAVHLGLVTKPTSLRISTLHGVNSVNCSKTKARLHSINGECTMEIDPLIVVDKLPVQKVDRNPVNLSKWPHLADIEFSNLPSSEVGLLLGCDVPVVHRVLDERVGREKEPFASKSVFGWVLRGPTAMRANSTRHVNAISQDSPSIESLLIQLYETEFQDMDPESRHISVEDERAYEAVSSSAKMTNGHYEVAIPWKGNEGSLSMNQKMASLRLEYLKRKFMKDRALRERYVSTMHDHIQKGHIRLAKECDKRWFLPHHPVINQKKPEKLRIVFDCAAIFRGMSLNDAILQGPDLTNNLTGVLLRFRRYPIALSADIKEMFLQVRLPEEDKWAFSLLWWGDDLSCENPMVYEFNVHPFGATSSPFCANYALRKTVSDNIGTSRLPPKENILRQFYVDDFLYSTCSLDEALRVTSELPEVLRQGGFDLVKWSSNSEEVLHRLDQDKCALTLKELTQGDSCQRTLGIKWYIVKDVFMFDVIKPSGKLTRRSLLSYVASIFDPLGFIAPLILPGKLLLQELCRHDVRWDVELNDVMMSSYNEWIDSLMLLSSLEIKRCLLPDSNMVVTCDLHTFSDASESAYSAVSYLRYEMVDGTKRCRFLMGKARVAPLKFTTIPRLELTAALIGAQLSAHVVKELDVKIDRIFFWTDSAIVLRYLANTSTRFVTFVANRVRRILNISKSNQWRYVPTKLNPADIGSRGVSSRSFVRTDLWLDGPTFLNGSEDKWPEDCVTSDKNDEALEVKRINATLVRPEHCEWLDKLTAYSRSWFSLLRKIVWLTRFKRYLMIKASTRFDMSLDVGHLKIREFYDARADVVRAVQSKAFDRELSGTVLRKLKPVIVDGIWCLGGRLRSQAHLKPIPIISNNTPVVELIIKHHHEICGHSGPTHVLASVRREYWIVKGMATVKRVLRGCTSCRVLHAPNCQQAMAPLPTFRTDSAFYPFYHTGVDCFGPFYVKINRSLVKRFGCLFTCMQTRAIHIEVVHSMGTDSFLMALDRFISRRGTPTALYSDNGSNFVGAESELKGFLDSLGSKRVHDAMLVRQIEWNFNPPAASHRGGAWERMIRTVRKVLSHLVTEQILTDEVLLTGLAEVERVVNDRPLVPVYDDPDQPTALRPNDLLLLKPNSGLVTDENIPLRERLTRRWRQAHHFANVFWKRWKHEYLPCLQITHKWLKTRRNLQRGDLVLLSKTDSPRGEWPKGVVVETYPGIDGLVRQVQIKTTNGTVRRDVRSLCLLEGAEE